MSAASSARTLRAAVPSFRSVASGSGVRCASTYVPRNRRFEDAEEQRPPRPVSPSYFSGKPEWADAMLGLETTVNNAHAVLRKNHMWPLPRELPYLQPPASAWKAWEALKEKELPMRAKGDYRALISTLNQLHHLRHVSTVAGLHDLAGKITAAVEPFESSAAVQAAALRQEARKKAQEDGAGIDSLGRVYSMGRRKASSARVWLVPTAQARELFATPPPVVEAETKDAEDAEAEIEVATTEAVSIPNGEILVNHLPLAQHFHRPQDREIVLRPLRVSGLLGAFNVFALVRGGGATGQSGAVALGVARALALARKDAVSTLINDNALHRDSRAVERKKTNRVKARKARTWVKR